MIERGPAGRGIERIVCDGRPVDATAKPTGPACGRTLHPSRVAASYLEARVPQHQPLDEARAAGWALGPDDTAMCPACRKPDRTPVDVSAYRSDPGPPNERVTPDPRYL